VVTLQIDWAGQFLVAVERAAGDALDPDCGRMFLAAPSVTPTATALLTKSLRVTEESVLYILGSFLSCLHLKTTSRKVHNLLKSVLS
jgi:hypothetical protein